MKTIEETATLFKVSSRTIRRWIREGALKSIKIRGTVRITDEEIDRISNSGAKEIAGISVFFPQPNAVAQTTANLICKDCGEEVPVIFAVDEGKEETKLCCFGCLPKNIKEVHKENPNMNAVSMCLIVHIN